MRRWLLALAHLLLSFGIASSAGAAIMSYTDRTDWNDAVGGDLFVEDFDDITMDTPFSSSGVDVGPFTIQQGGGNPVLPDVNLIDASPFSFSGNEDVNGSTYALGYVNSTAGTVATSTFIAMLFDVPVAAWGADFANANNTLGIDLYLIPTGAAGMNDWIFYDASAAGTGFFGFADNSGELYAGVAIVAGGVDVGGSGERFGFDNVSGATIPEPGTAALLALGLGGLAVAGRRRR
jgi:hypothetical protein